MSQSKRPKAEDVAKECQTNHRCIVLVGVHLLIPPDDRSRTDTLPSVISRINEVIERAYQAGRDDEKSERMSKQFEDEHPRVLKHEAIRERQEFIDKFVVANAASYTPSEIFDEASNHWDERERRRKGEGAKRGRSNAEIAQRMADRFFFDSSGRAGRAAQMTLNRDGEAFNGWTWDRFVSLVTEILEEGK